MGRQEENNIERMISVFDLKGFHTLSFGWLSTHLIFSFNCRQIYYYLEDDTISVVEPEVPNSGMPQGKLIKRQRLPKDELGNTWHWKVCFTDEERKERNKEAQ